MVVSETGQRHEVIAQELFEVITQFCLATTRGRRRLGDLKEVEFLSLSILNQHDTMIVGDIQRILGVLPAKMSRIIRSLENRDQPYINCRINPQDKRKIDVRLTPAGEKALLDYQTMRIRGISDILHNLAEEDQDTLSQLLDKLRMVLDRRAN